MKSITVSLKLRFIVESTMKNIHPVYHIKVISVFTHTTCTSCTCACATMQHFLFDLHNIVDQCLTVLQVYMYMYMKDQRGSIAQLLLSSNVA